MAKQISLLFFISLFFFGCTTSKQAVISLTPAQLSNGFDGLKSGDYIKLEPKEYLLNVPVRIENLENITIDGNGATLIMNSLSENVIHISGSKNIILKNFKATHIEPSGPTGCTGNVIYMDNSDDILVEKCALNGSGIVGIAAYNIGALKVVNNRIYENSEYGIIYMGPSIEIKNNVFEKNAKGHLFYSFIPKDDPTGWPPKNLINKDENREGLVMSGNTFK